MFSPDHNLKKFRLKQTSNHMTLTMNGHFFYGCQANEATQRKSVKVKQVNCDFLTLGDRKYILYILNSNNEDACTYKSVNHGRECLNCQVSIHKLVISEEVK